MKKVKFLLGSFVCSLLMVIPCYAADLYTYDDSRILEFLRELGIFLFFAFLIILTIGIYAIIVNAKILKKASRPGWAAIVPFYNSYVLYDITWGNGWYFLLGLCGFIPTIGVYLSLFVNIVTNIKLAKSFNKEGDFAVGLIFLPIIFRSILAFGKSEYVGASNAVFKTVPENKEAFDSKKENVNEAVYEEKKGNVSFCPNCGTKLEEKGKYCPNCGNKL